MGPGPDPSRINELSRHGLKGSCSKMQSQHHLHDVHMGEDRYEIGRAYDTDAVILAARGEYLEDEIEDEDCCECCCCHGPRCLAR